MERVLSAFVCMPFSEENKNTYDFAIKLACKECKIYCRRLDEITFSQGMMEQLYLEIGRADLIIADMSYVDANVTYEVGYAHGINKEIILLSNDVKTIPFNLKYYQHIIFNKNDLAGLQNKLRTALKAYVEKITSSPGHEQIDSIASSEAKPFSLHAWNSWGGIRVFSCENEIVLRGDAETSGYVNDQLGHDLAGKTLILYITNTKDSNFSMNRLVKMTVNQDDKLLVPDKKYRLISNEYVQAIDGMVEYAIPDNFDGKLGFVFYEAKLNDLHIKAFYK